MSKTMEEKTLTAIEKAKDYLKELPNVYDEEEIGGFDEIIKQPTDNDKTEITVEVSPYWGSIDELNGGLDEIDYDDKGFISVDDIPLLKKDLVVRVIERDYESSTSDTIELYHYDEKSNKLVQVI